MQNANTNSRLNAAGIFLVAAEATNKNQIRMAKQQYPLELLYVVCQFMGRVFHFRNRLFDNQCWNYALAHCCRFQSYGKSFCLIMNETLLRTSSNVQYLFGFKSRCKLKFCENCYQVVRFRPSLRNNSFHEQFTVYTPFNSFRVGLMLKRTQFAPSLLKTITLPTLPLAAAIQVFIILMFARRESEFQIRFRNCMNL